MRDEGHNGDELGVREPAPRIPWEIYIDNSVTHYVKKTDGGMVLCFTPGVATPNGIALTSPQIKIDFSKEGWERFRIEVGNDGLKSRVVIATPDRPII